MRCDSCDSKGVIVLNWADAPEEYALCLCPMGRQMRRQDNTGRRTVPLWEVWAAAHQVEPERVWRLEDVLSVEELQARGFSRVAVEVASQDSALMAASRRLVR